MYISTNDWLNYINKLSKLNKSAADAIVAYVQKNGFSDTDALISYANAVVQTYGSGSAALAAAMYDATAEAAGYFYDPAEPAALPGYGEIAKTVKGTLKTSQNVNELAGAVSRLVKRAGADTTLQNAYRDRPRKKYGKKRNTGAQIAWVPHGDTCPFCLMLASNGWRNQTVGGAQNHAEHIHSNCDCTYAVRFDDHSGVQGYDPDVYKDMYDNAEGDTWKEKVNSMRRAQYEKDKDRINAQKRAAYAERKTHSMKRNAETVWKGNAKKITEEEFIGLDKFASNLEIVLDPGFKSFDGDVDLVKDFLTRINENLDGRSFARNRNVRLAVSYTMDDSDYALTNGATVTINGFAFRDRKLLEDDYNERLKDKWFTDGSTYLDIGTHESAHVIVYLDQLKVSGVMDSVFGKDKSNLIDNIVNNISEYALKNNDELVAESYVAYRNGSKNEYVLKVLQYSGIVK